MRERRNQEGQGVVKTQSAPRRTLMEIDARKSLRIYDTEVDDLQFHRIGRIVQDIAVDEKHFVVGHLGWIDQQETVSAGDEYLLVPAGAEAASRLDVEPKDRHACVSYGHPHRLGLKARTSGVG